MCSSMNNNVPFRESPPPEFIIFGDIPAMTIEESRGTQRPYRYGMVLLCIGAVINWLGLAENYVEPVKYIGVTCIVAGALLICVAMCCWLHTPPTRTTSQTHRTTHPITAQIDDPIHVISMEEPAPGARQKPPDYEAVADAPPSYDDAIKLNPGQLAWTTSSHRSSIDHQAITTGGGGATVIGPPSNVVGVVVVPVEAPALTPPPPYARVRRLKRRSSHPATKSHVWWYPSSAPAPLTTSSTEPSDRRRNRNGSQSPIRFRNASTSSENVNSIQRAGVLMVRFGPRSLVLLANGTQDDSDSQLG